MSIDKLRLDASLSYTGYVDSDSYQKSIIEGYKYKINDRFDLSSSFTTIQEEYPYGSGTFRDLDCRVVGVRTVGTGTKMSDSYKTIIFKSQDHPKNIGYLYKFKNNYWIACNSDIMSSPTDSIVVRRCNNILRWEDKNGNIQSVPISFEDESFYLNNQEKQEIDRSSGYKRAIIQRTDLTKTLRPNQRFIFGEQCLKISGSGIGSFLNQVTDDDSSPSVIRLNFEYDYINYSTDDMVNKIANAFSNEYSISIDQTDTTYSVSSTAYTFTATVLNNGEEIERDVSWDIVSENSYTSSIQDNKLNIIFTEVGQYKITASVKDNLSLKKSIDITTINSDKYIIQCSQIPGVVYKGDSETFSFGLYMNGVVIPDASFTFEKIDNLTNDYYTYSVDGNNIIIYNKKMSTTKVNIKCSVSNYSVSEYYTLSIKLGGAW